MCTTFLSGSDSVTLTLPMTTTPPLEVALRAPQPTGLGRVPHIRLPPDHISRNTDGCTDMKSLAAGPSLRRICLSEQSAPPLYGRPRASTVHRRVYSKLGFNLLLWGGCCIALSSSNYSRFSIWWSITSTSFV